MFSNNIVSTKDAPLLVASFAMSDLNPYMGVVRNNVLDKLLGNDKPNSGVRVDDLATFKNAVKNTKQKETNEKLDRNSVGGVIARAVSEAAPIAKKFDKVKSKAVHDVASKISSTARKIDNAKSIVKKKRKNDVKKTTAAINNRKKYASKVGAPVSNKLKKKIKNIKKTPVFKTVKKAGKVANTVRKLAGKLVR